MRALASVSLVVLFALVCGEGVATTVLRRSFDVQGHRGARGLAPENTLAGFAVALELGVTTLELDLGMTRDGEVIVAHDPYVNPKLCLTPTGERLALERGPLLKHLDLDELQAFDCGSLNPDRERFPEPPRVNVPGEAMPSLRQVIALTRERGDDEVRFNVEVKTEPGSDDTVAVDVFVKAVVEILREEKVLERSTLQAFDWRVLQESKRLEPALRTAGLLYELDPKWQAGIEATREGGLLGVLREAKPFLDGFSPHWELVVPGEKYAGHTTDDYATADYRVVPWTVNDPAAMKQLIELNVAGIITDYPDRLIAVLKETRPRWSTGKAAE